MNFGICEGLELFIFDVEGKQVAHINYSTDSLIDGDKIWVRSNLIGEDLLGFIHKEEKNDKSDFDNFFKGNALTYVVNNRKTVRAKIIAKTAYRSQETGVDHAVYYEIPKVIVRTDLMIRHDYKDIAELRHLFEIESYNESGDLYKIHIAK